MLEIDNHPRHIFKQLAWPVGCDWPTSKEKPFCANNEGNKDIEVEAGILPAPLQWWLNNNYEPQFPNLEDRSACQMGFLYTSLCTSMVGTVDRLPLDTV